MASMDKTDIQWIIMNDICVINFNHKKDKVSFEIVT